VLENSTYQWRKASVLVRIIVILVFFFAIQTVFFLSTRHYITALLANLFGLNNQLTSVFTKPWTLFTYSLFHKDVNHFLGNIIFFYFIGREFLNLFSSKQMLQVVFGGILSGAFVFLAMSNLITTYNGEAILLGFSAGVFALLATITAYRPTYNVYFTERAKVKIWIIAVIFILYTLLTSNRNSGGNFAHFGGVLFGIIFGLNLKGIFALSRKTNLKTVHRSVIKSTSNYSKDQETQINRILDKINKSGYDSLSKKEKTYLFKQKK